jgi:hypothetical protein
MARSTDSANSANMKYQQHYQLPTKCVPSPTRLLQAVKDKAGEGNYHIEVRFVERQHLEIDHSSRLSDAAQHVLDQLT